MQQIWTRHPTRGPNHLGLWFDQGGHHGGRGPRVDALGLFTRKQPARIGGQPLAAMVAGGGDPAGLPKLHAAQVKR